MWTCRMEPYCCQLDCTTRKRHQIEIYSPSHAHRCVALVPLCTAAPQAVLGRPRAIYLTSVQPDAVGDERNCAICLEHLGLADGLAAPPCSHVMHENCLRAWFLYNPYGGCPICRADATRPLDA